LGLVEFGSETREEPDVASGADQGLALRGSRFHHYW
jgi:hypothetical protein